jgi:hypothetical protein
MNASFSFGIVESKFVCQITPTLTSFKDRCIKWKTTFCNKKYIYIYIYINYSTLFQFMENVSTHGILNTQIFVINHFASYIRLTVSLLCLQQRSASTFVHHFELYLFFVGNSLTEHFAMLIADFTHVFRK